MYLTSKGERVLKGVERKPFIAGVLSIYDAIMAARDCGDPDLIASAALWPQVFATMPPEQKLIALAEVAKGLLDKKQPAVPILAWRAATVAAVYASLAEDVELELDYESYGDDIGSTARDSLWPFCRKMRKVTPEMKKYLPRKRDEDTLEQWKFVIEICEDRINMDQDYAIPELIAETGPQHADMLRALGLSPDYLIALPPVDTEANTQAAIKYLKSLIGEH